MNGFASMGKLIIFMGVLLIIIGGMILLFSKVTGGRGALLPGDIAVKWGNLRIYFPIMTCILISIILTLILWLFGRLAE